MTSKTNRKLFLGIDSGTQGSKVAILDWDSQQVLTETYASHQLNTLADGGIEQAPQWWIDACEDAILRALSSDGIEAASVRAIGVSGQQHGFVPMDAEGKVIRPAKLWCDTATTSQCDAITDRMGGVQRVIESIGNAVAVGFTASKVLWLKEMEPEAYERLAMIMLPHDYINFWLTGEKKTEFGDASGTAYFDIRNRSWSTAILNAIDESGHLASCLPDLTEADEPIGVIRPEIAKAFGLSPDTLVSSGGGDNMMAAIGTGNVREGIVTASLGTSATIYAHADKPVVDPKGELAAFCSSTGAWLPLICTMNGTVPTELTRDLLGADIKQLNQLAVHSSVGSGGLILLPYFNGERTPALPHATATLFGMSSTNYTPQNLARVAMEGATFGLKYGLQILHTLGIHANEVRLVGGGAKSGLWRQIVADILGCPVVCPVNEEAGALGAAIQAAWCYEKTKKKQIPLAEITAACVKLDESKQAEPINENVQQYREIFSQYCELNAALKDVYKRPV